MNPIIEALIRAAVVVLVAPVLLLPIVYLFMKEHSHIMSRVGPMYAGRFHGVGQPIADFLKFLQKEDIVPAKADKWVFLIAPVVVLVPAIMIFAVIPVTPGIIAADIDIGLFYIMAISSVSAVGVVMAAYASQNKFTLIGGLRAVGQLIAYELPVILGAVSVAMLA